MIKAIVFDCFGVIITDALQGICQELRSRDPVAADEVRDLVRLANRGIMESEDYGKRVSELLGTDVAGYRRMISQGESKNMELMQYIEELKLGYKTGLLSNIGRGSLARRFTEDELLHHFDVVVASGEIGYAKPEPEAYEITADRLEVRMDECVFTDDRAEFCEAARGVGMQTILYTNFTQFRAELDVLLSDSKK